MAANNKFTVTLNLAAPDPFYSGTTDRYEVPFFALLVYPEFEVPNIFHT